MTTFRWGAVDHVGQVRQVNQDHTLAQDGLFAVADGMGGHRAGEVASEVAIDTLRATFTERATDRLVEAVQAANTKVVTLASEDPDLRGMGTTMSALALITEGDREVLAVVNVGDSRTYLLRAESEDLEQVTEDHSLVETLRRQGQITADEAAVHPQRNILTRALGIDAGVLIDSWELEPVKGDRYLLCSDGLFNEVDENRIASVLRRLADPEEAAAELVRLANEGGGRDNISVVVVDVVDADTDVGRAPGRVVTHVYGEDRSGAPAEAIPARPGGGAGETTTTADDDGGPATPAPPAARSPRSRLTWRVGLFALALLVVVGATVFGVDYAMSNTYYVGIDADEVVVFQGRPGGLLWLQPEIVERTGIAADDVPEQWANDLPDGIDAASRGEADDVVAAIEADLADAEPEPDPPAPDEGSAIDDAGTGLGGMLDEVPSTTSSTVVAPGVPGPPVPTPVP